MNSQVMGFSLLDDSTLHNGVDDSSDPMDGESFDGQLVYSVSLDKRSKVQIAGFSGRLASAEAMSACLGVLDSVFAAALGGTAQIDVGGLEEASETCLDALAAHLAAYLGIGGRIDLRLSLEAVSARLLKRLPRPETIRPFGWDDRLERLVVRF